MQPEFTVAWEEWLADSLTKGVPAENIAEVLGEAGGFPEDFVQGQIQRLADSPAFKAGRLFPSKHKLISLLEALARLYRESGYAENFSKVKGLSPTKFYESYYYVNRPVAMRGLLSNWKALGLWAPEYFRSEFGDCEIEITTGRDADSRYEENFSRHRRTVSMADYVTMIEEGGESNDFYMTARNRLLRREEFRCLFEHFSCPEGFLDPASMEKHVNLWFGPKGTVTPLHHDTSNNLFCQVYGRKRVKLVAPWDLPHLYNDRFCYSAVDLEDVDYEAFPRMRGVPVIDVVLDPGEAVLFPVGWWHWVKSLDVSISLSFTNFLVRDAPVLWESLD